MMDCKNCGKKIKDFGPDGETVWRLCREQSETERWCKAEQFMGRLSNLREDGISCPDGLRYTFAQDDRQEPKVSDTCQRYVSSWEEMKENNIGVLLYGSVGTGKSFYASCIGRGLLEKCTTVAATNLPRLLNLLQSAREKQELLDRLSSYELLILDDLGVERDSQYALEQVYNIVDARARSGLPLIVTTNLTLEELREPESMQYARIYDRVLEMCPIRIKLTGESRRKKNAAARKQLAQKLLLTDS